MKSKQPQEPQFRVVDLIGKSVSNTRKLYGTGNRSYSYACVIPKSMATALSLTEGREIGNSPNPLELI